MTYKTVLFLGVLILGCNDLFQNEQPSESRVWVYIESAERQCVTPDFASLEEAINQLTENNIAVLDSSEVNYVVCEACSCPTGIYFQALIYKKNQNEAFGLGWLRVDEGDDTPE